MTKTTDELEPLMRVVAHTAALAGVLETPLVEQQRARTERQAIQAQVDDLATRLTAYDQAPLLPDGAWGRIQRAQRERADLRAALGRLRERYVDAADVVEPGASADTTLG